MTIFVLRNAQRWSVTRGKSSIRVYQTVPGKAAGSYAKMCKRI